MYSCLLAGLLFQAAAAQFTACAQANTAFCETPVSGVTANNIILRCTEDSGQPTAGNCNDDLADVPPQGVKYAYCWESSPTAGDAQCTYNCVSVTAANGTTFFPVGCDRDEPSTASSAASGSAGSSQTITSSTPESSLSSFSQSAQLTTTTTTTTPSSSPTSTSASASKNVANYPMPAGEGVLAFGGLLAFLL